MKPFDSLLFILSHPLNSASAGAKASALGRYLGWQLQSRINGQRRIIPFVNDARLVVTRGRAASTGNLYTRLHEFAEMGFVLHALRAGDTFVDVGANIGAYSILAASLDGVRCIAFEPASQTFPLLLENVELNNFGRVIEAKKMAVGAENGEVLLTSSLDSVNHVAGASDDGEARESVPLTTIDSTLGARKATVIKIDVEGYELPVLEGATETLASKDCRAVIIEMNGSSARYGLDEDRIDKLLRAQGFEPLSYDPLSRKLIEINQSETGENRIYVRERAEMQQRLASAEHFRLPGGWNI